MPGIDPSRDYYSILEVTPKASRAEITKSYKRLVARYHPDRHQGNDLEDLAKEKLAELNEAYEVLKDENTRVMYDSQRGSTSSSGASRGYRPTSGYEHSQRQTTTKSGSWFHRLFLLIILAAALLLLPRILRSPQAQFISATVIALTWFLPRIVGLFKKKR